MNKNCELYSQMIEKKKIKQTTKFKAKLIKKFNSA